MLSTVLLWLMLAALLVLPVLLRLYVGDEPENSEPDDEEPDGMLAAPRALRFAP